MAYIGREPEYGAFEKQALTADGSTTTFTLDYTVGSSSSIFVSVAGVPQEPEVAYNIAGGGTQIVFTGAPASGDTVFVIFLGVNLDIATLGTGAFTGETAVTALQGADLFLVYDNSATALKKITTANVTGSLDITNQTGLTTAVQGADELLIYDSSATAVKKINLDNLIIGNTELAEQAANDDVLLIYDTSATEIKKIQKSNIATSLTYSAGAFTGDGSDTTFTINSGRSVNDILVAVNGLLLAPTDYGVSGTTLTFDVVPANGAEIEVRYLPI